MRRPTILAICTCLTVVSYVPSALAGPFDDRIEQAVQRGLDALRKMQRGDGGYGSDSVQDLGRSTLVGLTFLECGVAADDPLVKKIAESARGQSVESNRVYSLSLAILFFDRLGDERDVPLIQAMAVRLMEAQFREGGWSYTTPSPDEKEVQRLKTLLRARSELRAGGPGRKTETPPLDPDLAERVERIQDHGLGEHQARIQNNGIAGGIIDNSNTQFAIMGLWAARHHGLPTDASLRLCERYFRATHSSGTWGYSQNGEPYGRAAMTCAGLMGLAVGAGVLRDAQMRTTPDPSPGKAPILRDPLKDPLVIAGLAHVSDFLAKEAAQAAQGVPPNYYFLWSLERVGVTYSLSIMGGKNWHQIGSQILFLHQKPDGQWVNNHGPEADTCFALMFLKKANLARDLTSNLLKKPGQSTLRAGPTGATPDAEAKDAGGGGAEALRRELATASADRQAKILEQLRDGKGAEFTEALVVAIGEVKGEVQAKARDALAERFARMTAATIRDRFKEARPELRCAAALAAAMKEDKAFIPDLIALLDDGEGLVVRAAGVALRSLTGENYGPAANATPDERAKAVAAWKSWWKQQKGK